MAQLRAMLPEQHMLNFINKSGYRCDLIWCSKKYDVMFTKLEPEQSICILSTKEYTWYSQIGPTSLRLNGKESLPCDSLPLQMDIEVIVTAPVMSLYDMALMKSLAILPNDELIHNLAIPTILKIDLKSLRYYYNSQMYFYENDWVTDYDFNDMYSNMPYVVSVYSTYEYCRSLWRRSENSRH